MENERRMMHVLLFGLLVIVGASILAGIPLLINDLIYLRKQKKEKEESIVD